MTINKKNYTLTCQYCGETFSSSTHNRTYCNDRRCKAKALAAKRERIKLSMRNLRKWKKRHKTF
jgi:hypothetical protein